MATSRAAGAQRRGVAASFLALTALLAAALGYFKISEGDVFWHLKTGQVILETGRLVRTNLFSSTYPDLPWHNMEWLHEVALAAAYNGSGWGGVAVMKAALAGLTATALFAALVRGSGAPGLAAAVCAVVLALSRFRLTERPHLFTLLFFALLVLLVETRRERGGGGLWAAAPLFALWSNIHPELVLGLVYLGAVGLGEWLDGRAGPPDAARPRWEGLAVAGLSAAATALNPEGIRVFLAPLAVKGIEETMSITEFGRSTLGNAPLFWLLLLASVAALLARGARRDWATLLPLAALAVLGFLYVRSTTSFALAAAPVVHRALASWGEGSRAARVAVRAGAAAVACAALLWTTTLDWRMPYRWGHGPDERRVPAAAADFLLANELPANLYNHYNQGGYLIFRLFPKIRVFQDTRYQPYPPRFLASLSEFHAGGELQRLYEEHGVNTALVRRGEYGLLYPADRWGVVFWDDEWCVLVRRAEPNRAVLDELEYRAFLPGSRNAAERNPMLLARAVTEMRRNNRERAAPSWRIHLETGVALGRLRDEAAAERELRAAAALAPGEAQVWAYLSLALALQGRRDEAAEAATRARGFGPDDEKVRRLLRGAGV